MSETMGDREIEDSHRRIAQRYDLPDGSIDWTVHEGLPDELRVNPRATLRVLRHRLTQIEALLLIGKQAMGSKRGEEADARLRSLLSEDYLIWIDELSLEVGLILGDRARIRVETATSPGDYRDGGLFTTLVADDDDEEGGSDE